MPDSKEGYYRSQLQNALTAGHWNSNSPAKSIKGTFISWSELFRKFKKHGKQPETSEAASQAHFLSLLLETTQNPTEAEVADEKNAEKNALFSLGDECVIREERREDAQRGYDSLQQLGTSDEYAKQILAFFAYALGRPTECLDLVKGVSFASQLNTLKPAVVVTSTEDQPAHVTATDVSDSDAWMLMEAIRTDCLEGMSHEQISPRSPSQALAVYDKGVTLLRSYTISKMQLPRSGRGSFESFRTHKELWTWAERLLWRTIALSGQHRSIQQTFVVLRTYSLHSVHWPPSFQSHHRSLICSLYLRALIRLTPHSSVFSTRMDWLEEVRTVVDEYRAILNVSTSFPKAGEHNVSVEEFVDLCVAVWEAGGAMSDQVAWVIDIMWWATRLTFNSPRILRHMFRLLHISGDHDLAKRVLRLYVQVVKKARQTGTVDVQGHDTHDTSAMEPDAVWVQTLVQGTRMLCRVPKDVEDVREAEKLVELARECAANLNEEMRASLDLADGVCKSVLALKENNPERRGYLLSSSTELLSRAVRRHTTSSSLYHLALGLSRSTPQRDLAKAVDLCRAAVELEPNEIRNWHLLILLLSKQGEWKKAKGVVEAAIEIASDVEMRVRVNDFSSNGVTSRDFGSPNNEQINGEEYKKAGSKPLIDCDAKALPHASTLLGPIPDHPATSHRDLFDQVFQLRMTQIIVIERTEGPDSMEASWLEVFEWYSQRRDVGAHAITRAPSIDTRRSLSPMPNEMPQPTAGSMDIPTQAISTTQEGLTSETPLNAVDSADADTATIRNMRRSPEGGPIPLSSANVLQSSTSHGETVEGIRTSVDSQISDGRGKRMQQMLKDQVHKQQARITSMSKKLHYSTSRNSVSLPRSSSAPDLQEALARAGPYQASSIHSRRRISLSSRIHVHSISRSSQGRDSPPPLPPLPNMTQQQDQTSSGLTIRSPRERRLLSDLWLMSAATFRRLERIDQARCAIQEAEQIDAENVSVWVQFALYLSALGDDLRAVEAFNKALFIDQDSIPATVHLTQLLLTSSSTRIRSKEYDALFVAVGMLEELTRGAGWDVAEAWYLLAKGYGMQGRKVRQRECLVFALGLAEVRGARDVKDAVGLCL